MGKIRVFVNIGTTNEPTTIWDCLVSRVPCVGEKVRCPRENELFVVTDVFTRLPDKNIKCEQMGPEECIIAVKPVSEYYIPPCHGHKGIKR